MKYKINDTVVVKYDKQIVKGQIIEAKKTWFGNRYTVMFNVQMREGERMLYKKTAYKKYWEGQILDVAL